MIMNKVISNAKWMIEETVKDKEPLIKFIPKNKCVVDLLHLLLRITDQLYKLLFLKFERMKKNGKDLNLRPNLKYL